MSETPVEQLERLMQDQIALLDRAIQKTAADDIMDIGLLNENVNTICAAAEKLQPGDLRRIERPMAEMISRLEVLAVELEAFKQRAQAHGNH